MDRVELMTVQDCFQISGFGLILVPDFSVPDGHWKNFETQVSVVTPAGHRFDTEAKFNVSHFNIRDPEVSIDTRWRVVVVLPSVDKQAVPVGSQLLVEPGVRHAVLAGN